MSFAPVITPTGIIAPSYADILASLKGSMRSIFGSDIYLEPDSQDGQMLAIVATAIKDNNDSIIAAYLAFSPATAQGIGLSTVVKINGIRRLVASNSQVILLIVGQAGTRILSGQAADAAGNRWLLPDEVIIPPEGEINATATAVEAGSVAASPNTITTIVTPTRGWQSVTNPNAASPGEPVEDDATLRQRQAVSTQIPALSVKGAILGAIKNIIGVNRAYIYENDSDVTDSDGIPSHSISCVVEGGDAQTIGNAIARYKTPGTGTYGSTEITAYDPLGVPNLIYFFELFLVQVRTIVNLRALTGYVSTTGDAIAASLAEWMNTLDIGQDVALNKLWSPVNLTGDAAIDATGFTQLQLDPLGKTYNALSIYQARSDMVITGGPYSNPAVIINVQNPDDFVEGGSIMVALDNGTFLTTTVTNIAGTAITMANAIPAGREAVDGAFVYVAGDLTILFNEAAAAATPANTTINVVV